MEKDVLFCDSTDTRKNGAPTQVTRRLKRTPRLKKTKVLKITLLTVLPICCIAFAIGVLLAVEYISRKSEHFQVSNSTYLAVVKIDSDSDSDEPFMNQSSTDTDTENFTATASINTSTLVVSPFITSANPPWDDCGSKLGKVLAVHSEDCPLQDRRCQLPVGTEGLIEVMFQLTPAVSVPVDALGATVCGSPRYFSSLCVESKLKEANPCENSNLQCPLQPGEKYVYRMLGGLKKEDLPSFVTFDIDVNLYIRLTDLATKQLVLCVKMPVTVTML